MSVQRIAEIAVLRILESVDEWTEACEIVDECSDLSELSQMLRHASDSATEEDRDDDSNYHIGAALVSYIGFKMRTIYLESLDLNSEIEAEHLTDLFPSKVALSMLSDAAVNAGRSALEASDSHSAAKYYLLAATASFVGATTERSW